MDRLYFPKIKTTPAELKAFTNLTEERKAVCCPILELTRGVKEKIGGQIKRIQTQIGDNTPFIMELTQDDNFQDALIERYQNEHQNGYESWRKFLDTLELENFIPSLVGSLKHLEDFVKQIKFFDKYHKAFAYRLPVSLDDTVSDLSFILSHVVMPNVSSSEKVYLLLDFREIKGDSVPLFLNKLEELYIEIRHLGFKGRIVPMFSSYSTPLTNKNGRGPLEKGEIPLEEFVVCRKLKDMGADICYSDYAFIQPKRNSSAGILWYPRIEFPTTDKCYWMRYYNKRQNVEDLGEGKKKYSVITDVDNVVAYSDIAQKMSVEQWFQDNKVNCWGTNEIVKATDQHNKDIGKSPQHWIAVRANIHMSRMADYLAGYDLV